MINNNNKNQKYFFLIILIRLANSMKEDMGLILHEIEVIASITVSITKKYKSCITKKIFLDFPTQITL